MTEGLLILDFDGTLCLGDGPVLAYASEVARALSEPETSILAPLAAFLDGAPHHEFGESPDGYSAVARWAQERGLDAPGRSAAYARSRLIVDSSEVPVTTPHGVEQFLQGFSGWHRVLVTNAPQLGTERLVGTLGLGAHLESIIGDARKPEGLRALAQAGGDLDLQRWPRALSIGDIWRNDLEPVSAAATTVLIERHPQPEARPGFRASRIEDLYGSVAHWRTPPTTVA